MKFHSSIDRYYYYTTACKIVALDNEIKIVGTTYLMSAPLRFLSVYPQHLLLGLFVIVSNCIQMQWYSVTFELMNTAELLLNKLNVKLCISTHWSA